MTDVRALLAEIDEEIMLADGFDEAILGYTRGAGQTGQIVVVYEEEKCIEVLMERDGMSREDALDFFESQVACAFYGDRTPLFLSRLRQP